MYCLPECKPCVTAGTCPKGEVPATPVYTPKPKRKWEPPIPGPVNLPKNFRGGDLECGHYTSREAQLLSSVWRPKDEITFWCTRCGDWQKIIEKKRVTTVDDTPPF